MPAARRILILVAGAALAAGALALASAQEGTGAPPRPTPGLSTSSLVTLHAGDPVSHVLDLSDGSFGARINGPLLVERRAHVGQHHARSPPHEQPGGRESASGRADDHHPPPDDSERIGHHTITATSASSD